MIDWQGPARQPCPQCDRSARDKACGVTVDDDGRGVAHCFRCGYVETRRGDIREGARPKPVAAAIRFEALSEYGQQLWAACRPLSGPALAYLEARGCIIPPADGDLRWHPALPHPPTGYVGPALVALLTDAQDRTPRTLHRTWVLPTGQKANVDPPRMQLGRHRKAGAVCRLWPDEAVTLGLGLAEGIETALSLAHAFTPVWAAVDAGNLAAMPVLGGIESVLIAADHDEAGIAAAEGCAARWAAAGRDAHIAMPPQHKTDMNDLARAA